MFEEEFILVLFCLQMFGLFIGWEVLSFGDEVQLVDVDCGGVLIIEEVGWLMDGELWMWENEEMEVVVGVGDVVIGG